MVMLFLAGLCICCIILWYLFKLSFEIGMVVIVFLLVLILWTLLDIYALLEKIIGVEKHD